MAAPRDAPDAERPPTLAIDAAGVATIRLNRPRHHNRLEPGDVGVLRDIIRSVAASKAARVAVVAASGRTFSAGYDLADLGKPGSERADEGIAILAETIDELEACPVPTVAALNGPVFGGGTDLALACDFRVGTPACGLRMPAAQFGLHYYHGGMRRYVTRLGLGAAKRLFLLAETIDAGEMRQIGFLDEIVPDADALVARVDEIARAICGATDHAVVASMKACLNRIAAGDMDPSQAEQAWARTRRSPQVGQAVTAARARPPRVRP
ncbi:MAG TPA: enoyl-CoA hydratase/isomerase family protein [Acetobacteraceae bacterium]|nr:enoyl-CoA hydratase/isomerase family protein [Acetobacteraceae bacterium]